MTPQAQPADAARCMPRRIRWPRTLLGPPPGMKEVNLACWALLAAMVFLKAGVPLWLKFKTGADSLNLLPADFIYFYGIGTIANHYPLAQLYDYSLQLRTFNAIYALHDQAYGPSPYPPFVAIFFALFARLSFQRAFVLWGVFSLVMYLVGIVAAAREFFSGEPLKASLTVCLALSFYSFLIGTLANGQLTAVAVCAVGLAFVFDRHEKPVWSGLALSLLAYKPTLLLLIVPMMLVTRRFKTILGFLIGVVFLLATATALGGVAVWRAYLQFITLFGKVAGLGDRSGLPLAKFVDLGSCLQLAAGGRFAAGTVFSMLVAGAVFVALVILWWRSARSGKEAQAMLWAATLTWTLLVSIYVPIYDSSLVALAMVWTIGSLAEWVWPSGVQWMVLLAVVTEVASWFTTGFARQYHVQILSIAIFVLGVAQLAFLVRMVGGKRGEAAVRIPAAHPADASLDSAID